MLALATAVWVVSAAGIVFLLVVIVRWTFALVREVKGLGRSIRAANDRLSDAMIDVTAGARESSEIMERITRPRPGRRRRRG